MGAHRIRWALLASLLAAVPGLLACGADEDCCAVPDGLSEPVTLTVDGFFPPFSMQVTIQPDGSGRVVSTVESVRKRASFDLSAGELAAINTDLARLEAAESESAGREFVPCADCPLYRVRSGELDYRADIASLSPDASELTERIEELGRDAIERGPVVRSQVPPSQQPGAGA
jgi:hypothetical protein